MCTLAARKEEVAAALVEAKDYLCEAEGHTKLQWVDAWQLGCDERALKTAAKAGAMAAAAAAGVVRTNNTHLEPRWVSDETQTSGGARAVAVAGKRLPAAELCCRVICACALQGEAGYKAEWDGGARAAVGRWLVKHNATGIVTRQEVVSMLPVALLRVLPHHTVLDMCASPGSKTTQALEAVAGGAGAGGGGKGVEGGAQGGGYVVANELVGNRAHVLAARCAALGGAASSLLVSSHRAQIFPHVAGAAGYDRIICDVPCSGDGTFRKHRDKWGHWAPHQGRELHALQLQIALRAASLLAEGGQMAYSTCSLNPLEDEAVVAALLKRGRGALELVKVDQRLPGFHFATGLRTWTVVDERMRAWASYAQLTAATAAERRDKAQAAALQGDAQPSLTCSCGSLTSPRAMAPRVLQLWADGGARVAP